MRAPNPATSAVSPANIEPSAAAPTRHRGRLLTAVVACLLILAASLPGAGAAPAPAPGDASAVAPRALSHGSAAHGVAANGEAAPAAPDQGPRQWRPEPAWEASFDPASMLDPRGIDLGASERFYVADTGRDRVVVLGPNGALLATLGSSGLGASGLRQPTDVAVDPDRDRVYVVDRGNKRINIFDTTGRPVARWTRAGNEFSLVPLAVTVDHATGDVYVLSTSIVSRVERFTQNGQWITGWGEIGLLDGQFIAPQDLEVLPDSTLLVADAGNGRVHHFDPAGQVRPAWSILPGVRGLALDPGLTRVYTLHGQGDRIGVHALDGRVLDIAESNNLPAPARFRPGQGIAAGTGSVAVSSGFGSADAGHGVRLLNPASPPATGNWSLAAQAVVDPRQHAGFFRPTALDVEPGGNLLVADSPVRAVRRLDPSGAHQGVFDTGPLDEVAAGPNGTFVTADVHQLVRIRQFSQAGVWQWDKACPCLSGMGLAHTDTAIYATDAVSQALQVFDLDPDAQAPARTVGLANPPVFWPLDVDRAPDGSIVALDGLGRRVTASDPATDAEVWSFLLPVDAQRLSVGPDGTVFVLYFDGTVGAYDTQGIEEDRWEVKSPGGAATRPGDIAAGPDGVVYVLDEATHRIQPYRPDPAAATPTPSPTAEVPCVASGDKTAAPGQVQLGDAVTVTLTLDIDCAAGAETRADIVLILDRSSSMAGEGCLKLCQAQQAANNFVDALDLSRHRVSVVSFSESVVLDLPLSSDAQTLKAAIDAIQPAGNTNIAGALALATEHVQAAARPDALPVYLLLTDGDPSGAEQAFVDTVLAGTRARATGGLVYAIGLGADVRAELLQAVAGAEDRYFFAPTPEDLDPIYDRLSQSIGGIVASNVTVEDTLGPDVEYVPGSASGSPQLQGRTLSWDLGIVPAGGVVLTYRVLPQRTGTVPTNDRAEARYTVEGAVRSYTYPVPTVEVLGAPTETPDSPTSTPTATATPTRVRTPGPTQSVYLPILWNNVCLFRDRRLGTDIVLVIDISSSMAADNKLEAAKAAAQEFISLADARTDRIGVVAFDAQAHLVYLISQDLPAVSRAMAGLQPGSGTRIDLGIQRALLEFDWRARPDSQRVMIVLSDGVPTTDTGDEALAAAEAARGRGITVFTIGLGGDADMALLRRLAGRDANAFFAPSPGDLAGIYRGIAERLPCR